MTLRQTATLDLTVWDAATDPVTRSQMTGNFDKIDEAVLTKTEADQRIADALADYWTQPRDLAGGTTIGGAPVVDASTDQDITGRKAFTAGLTLPDGATVDIGATIGATIGTSTSKLGLYGAAPVARAAAYTTAGAGARVQTTYTPADRSAAYTTNNLADLNDLRAAYETLRADHENLRALVVQLIGDVSAVGIAGA